MEQLVATVRESCSVSVLDGGDIVYVERVPTKRIMAVAINVGTRFPAYPTSMGRVLLAGQPPAVREEYLRMARLLPLTPYTVTDRATLVGTLEEVARQGWAMVDQELEEGLRSIAAPIHDRTGTVVGAVNVSVHASRTSVESMQSELLPPLLAATTRIDADLSVSTPRPRRPV
jgi:IclR family pca regulon transcriptional regulator